MKWVSKNAPMYVYLDDYWERETDRKAFKPDKKLKGWVADDGEIVHWSPKTKVIERLVK